MERACLTRALSTNVSRKFQVPDSFPGQMGRQESALSCWAGLWGPGPPVIPFRMGISQGPGQMSMSPRVTMVHLGWASRFRPADNFLYNSSFEREKHQPPWCQEAARPLVASPSHNPSHGSLSCELKMCRIHLETRGQPILSFAACDLEDVSPRLWG